MNSLTTLLTYFGDIKGGHVKSLVLADTKSQLAEQFRVLAASISIIRKNQFQWILGKLGPGAQLSTFLGADSYAPDNWVPGAQFSKNLSM